MNGVLEFMTKVANSFPNKYMRVCLMTCLSKQCTLIKKGLTKTTGGLCTLGKPCNILLLYTKDMQRNMNFKSFHTQALGSTPHIDQTLSRFFTQSHSNSTYKILQVLHHHTNASIISIFIHVEDSKISIFMHVEAFKIVLITLLLMNCIHTQAMKFNENDFNTIFHSTLIYGA